MIPLSCCAVTVVMETVDIHSELQGLQPNYKLSSISISHQFTDFTVLQL